MSINMTVRPMHSGEVSAAAALEREVFSDPWSEATLSDMAESQSYTLLCAVSDDGSFLGYIAASHAAGECEVLRIASAPGFRRLGVGKALLDRFIDERRGADDLTVFLEVRASNAAAAALYHSRGFEEYATRRGYYKAPVEDALMLRLDL